LYLAENYPRSSIVAVEPHPDTFDVLQTNLRSLVTKGRCRLIQAAVWGSKTSLVGHADEERHFSAFAVQEGNGSMQGLPISNILAQSGFESVDVLKIDIEGAETELFKGDLGWLDRVCCIAIEFHDGSRRTSRFDEIMREHGFAVTEGKHTVIAIRA
jgi:FkbM family methyltransferase